MPSEFSSISERLNRTLRERLWSSVALADRRQAEARIHPSRDLDDGDFVLRLPPGLGAARGALTARAASLLADAGEVAALRIRAPGVIAFRLAPAAIVEELRAWLSYPPPIPRSSASDVTVTLAIATAADAAVVARGRAQARALCRMSWPAGGKCEPDIRSLPGRSGVQIGVQGPGFLARALVGHVQGRIGSGSDPDRETERDRRLLLRTPVRLPLDLDRARDRVASAGDPMYMVQRAHARGATMVRYATRGRAVEEGAAEAIDARRLEEPEARALVVSLAALPDALGEALREADVSGFVRHQERLAGSLVRFMEGCRVTVPDAALATARLALLESGRRALATAMTMVGVRPPERRD